MARPVWSLLVLLHAIVLLALVALLLATSIMSLVTMGDTYQLQPERQNSLYFLAFALPFVFYYTHDYALYLARGQGAKATEEDDSLLGKVIPGSRRYNSCGLIMSGMAQFVAASSCFVAGIDVMQTIRAPHPHVDIVSPKDWVPGARLTVAAHLYAGFFCLGHFFIHFFIACGQDKEDEAEHEGQREFEKEKKEEKSNKPCYSILALLYWGLRVAATLMLLAEIGLSIWGVGSTVWQQCDSPLFFLYLSFMMAWGTELYSPGYMVLVCATTLVGLCFGISYLALEIERVRGDAGAWASNAAYLSMFGDDAVSRVFHGIYRYVNYEQSFASAFAYLSVSLHQLHVVVVATGFVLLVSEVVLAFAMLRGWACSKRFIMESSAEW